MISTCEGPGCGVVTAVNMVGTAPTYRQGSPTINEARERRALSNTVENNVQYSPEIPYESMTPFIPIPESAWEMPVMPMDSVTQGTGATQGTGTTQGAGGAWGPSTTQGAGATQGMGSTPGMGTTPGMGSASGGAARPGTASVQNGVIPPVPGTSDVPMGTGAAAAGISSGQGIGSTLGIGQGQGASVGSLPSEETVFQNAPTFTVPNNPLLPPGYQEVMDYGNLQYMNGFLRTQIGKYVRIQQLVGSSVIEDRFGYLVGVGINYILLQEISTGNILALDFWNIKYVYVYYTKNDLPTNSMV